MDLDREIEAIIDPINEIFGEINLNDIFELLDGKPKIVLLRNEWILEDLWRKRAVSLLLLDIGSKSKCYNRIYLCVLLC